jgi:peroxiredoxin Q/BCP
MIFLSLVISLLLASGSGADAKRGELKVGDTAPAFEARTDADTTWTSSERFGKKWVVIYFYPGDFTPGCTAQAKAFRDAMNQLTKQGVAVIGISGDSVTTHALFKKAQKLNFTLLADEDGTVAKLFGVPVSKGGKVKAKDAEGKPIEITRNVTAARWTFVIGTDGKIAYKNVKVNPGLDARAISEFIARAEGK